MTVRMILQRKGNNVVSVTPDMTLMDAVKVLRQHRIGCVLVMEGGGIAGVLSERDVVRAIGNDGAAALEHKVSSAMTSPVITCMPDDSVATAMGMMTERRFRHLPVMDGSMLVGMVSIGDLVKQRIDDSEREAAALKDYISGA
jgi:CBS domain-containing protein